MPTPHLGQFVLELLSQAQASRRAGVPEDVIREGLRRTVLEEVHRRGLVVDESQIPRWQLMRCPLCRDTGWSATTRQTRFGVCDAVERCSCRPVGSAAPEQAADRAAAGWGRGRR